MKKELTVYINTNEEGEEIKVSRVNDGTNQFMLLTLGGNRMVVDVAELMEAVGAIGHYSTLFDQEHKIREQRKKAPPAIVVTPPPAAAKKAAKHKEDENALVLEAQVRTGPTASELALEKQMKLMQGESLVFKKDE